MRIAILDDYQNCIKTLVCFALLKDHEVEVSTQHHNNPQSLAAELNDPEALVLNRTRTKITPELLSLLPSLKVVSQTGKNAGHIDVEACKTQGVTILEGKGDPTATAELTWALILNGLRLLPQAITGMKNGHWQTNLGRRIAGTTVGIWGYGKIGRRIARYAEVFDAKVIVWGSEASRHQAEKDGYTASLSKKEFFSSSDVVSLHLRLKEATKGIVKLSDLNAMKPEALLVNTARAGLIEQGALETALTQGRPGYAAIDVFDEEPIFVPDHPLLAMDNVICTPHLGYVEKESYELYFGIAFKNLIDFLK